MATAAYLLLLLAAPVQVYATQPGVAWVKGYSFGSASLESHPHAGVQTADGGFLMVGDGVDYAEPKPGLKRHLLAAKLDSNGKILWEFDLGERGYNYGKFGVELPDGTFIISGALTAVDPQHGELLHRALIRLDPHGQHMQTLMMRNQHGEEHKQDGFTGIAIGDRSNDTFVVTGVVGAENATSSYPDAMMFLALGGLPCFTRVQYNETWLSIVHDQVYDELPGCLKSSGCMMYEGMRVVYDPDAMQYVVATNLYYPDRGMNEMGAIALDVDGAVKWMKAFPASHDGMSGVMSQPYALAYTPPTADANRSYAIGGHWFWSEASENVLQAGGRMIGVSASGELVFDTRWKSGERDANIECYGLQATRDGGFVMTCGNGVEPELHPHDSQIMKTWMVFVARTDPNGNKLWSGNFTEPEHFKQQNDAGEYIIATRKGKIAVYVDSQTWGPTSTGGNFALMMLKTDDITSG